VDDALLVPPHPAKTNIPSANMTKNNFVVFTFFILSSLLLLLNGSDRISLLKLVDDSMEIFLLIFSLRV